MNKHLLPEDKILQITLFGDDPVVLDSFSKMSIAELNENTANSGLTYLHYAVSSHKVAMIKLLLEKGVDPNSLDEKGVGGMILTALGREHNSNCDILRLFLEHGLDLNQEINNSTVRDAIFSFNNDEYNKIIKEFESSMQERFGR